MAEFISVDEEMAAEQRLADEASYKEFVAQWDTENIPACDEGMRLLKAFSDAHPSAFQLARKVNFIDPPHPMFRALKRWHAFTEHVSSCPKCNEAG